MRSRSLACLFAAALAACRGSPHAGPATTTDSSAASPVRSTAVESPPSPPPELPPPSTAEMKQLASATNAFGLDLYQRIRSDHGNLVFSPTSIATALSMTWAGAKGDTAAQMQKVLRLRGSGDQALQLSGKLISSLVRRDSAVMVRIVNRLFAEKTYPLEPRFLDATKSAFGAPLEPVDFKTAPEPARARINGWVEQQTEKRIKELVPKNGVNTQTRLALVNAIYFLGDWDEPFEKYATSPSAFSTPAAKKDVPTMHGARSRAQLGEVDDVKALELPYKGGALSMLFLLPNAVDGLGALEASLTAAKLDAITQSLFPQHVLVSLPKFIVSPPMSMTLRTPLEAMGMPLAFDGARADFTGIANPANAAERLFIGEVFHKAFVRVDEQGTEAAAATEVGAKGTGGPMRQVPEFKADHPFLFLLRDTASGLVLFMGRVEDPASG